MFRGILTVKPVSDFNTLLQINESRDVSFNLQKDVEVTDRLDSQYSSKHDIPATMHAGLELL